VTAAPVTPGTLRVVVSRRRASVPGCPDWSRDASLEIGSNTSSNFGCAVNSNLAAMIANPADLVRGRNGPSATDPLLSTKAIDSYRKAPATGATGIKAEKAGGK
jgi:pilus assembly protein CpaD